MRIQWVPTLDLPSQDIFKGYIVRLVKDGTLQQTWVTMDTLLMINVTEGSSYTVTVATTVENGPEGENANITFRYYNVEESKDEAVVVLSQTHLVAIVVPVVLVMVTLGVVAAVFYIRHRRLQRSFLAFANSHYNTRSGTTTFSSDLDDDEPMIQGFSDDEPLVLA